MDEDRTELADLAEGERARVEEMSAMYDDWASRSNVLPWERVWPPPRGSVPD